MRREAGGAAEAIEAAVAASTGTTGPARSSPPVPTPGCCARCSSPGARCRSSPGRGRAARLGRALDLVVVLAPDGGDTGTASAVAEAVRRGCRSSSPARRGSLVAEHAAGRYSTILPVSAGDQLATAVVMLEFLDRLDLGPETDPEAVATALDDVAIECSPYRDQSVNPAKMLAIALADSVPAGLGRVGARRPGRAPGGRVDPPGQRPRRARRRRRAPAAGHRRAAGAGRLRRPVRGRPRRPTAARRW